MDYESQIQKSKSDIERLKGVLKSIHEHQDFLNQQFLAYKEYLSNVRTQQVKVTKKGPFKFSHTKLMQDGVIIESEVPEER